jgi:hypothetical protein
LDSLHELISQTLLPALRVESVRDVDPVVAHEVPSPWQVLGCGNYAAVLVHPRFNDVVVKVYAPGRPGLQEEVEVYDRLGEHHSFSRCLGFGENFLILKRWFGVTLYDCVVRGIPIPSQVIQDIDDALEYAQACGLNPHDVHGRNIMVVEGRGVVVDVSDFLVEEDCGAWGDLKNAYKWFYRPFILPLGIKIPHTVLNLVRRSYRQSRRVRSWAKRK